MPRLPGLAILLVEHEEATRTCLGQALEHYGGHVISVADGRAAMHLYHQYTYDLVVTELLLPERDGLEIIMELRKFAPETRIIAMSNGGSAAWRDVLGVAEKLGAQRTLLKPFTTRQLLSTIVDLFTVPHTSAH